MSLKWVMFLKKGSSWDTTWGSIILEKRKNIVIYDDIIDCRGHTYLYPKIHNVKYLIHK